MKRKASMSLHWIAVVVLTAAAAWIVYSLLQPVAYEATEYISAPVEAFDEPAELGGMGEEPAWAYERHGWPESSLSAVSASRSIYDRAMDLLLSGLVIPLGLYAGKKFIDHKFKCK